MIPNEIQIRYQIDRFSSTDKWCHILLSRVDCKNNQSSIYFLLFLGPNAPGHVTVIILNNTAANVSWESPANSQGVNNINYSVQYVSDFWKETGNFSLIGNNSVVIGGLKSGSKYNFNVTVWAGDLESLPSMATGITSKEIIAF